MVTNFFHPLKDENNCEIKSDAHEADQNKTAAPTALEYNGDSDDSQY
jgi:hypothetical protein